MAPAALLRVTRDRAFRLAATRRAGRAIMQRPWAIDLTSPEGPEVVMPKPPGYSERDAHDTEVEVRKKVDYSALKIKKAKELAWQPGKSFMMTGLMLWMSGNGVHIFSIMITFYAIYNPIKAGFTVNQAFARFDDPKYTSNEKTQLFTAKLTYIAMNILAMGGGLYKMSMMGLLPNTPSDWMFFIQVPPALQTSSGGLAMSG